MRRTAVLLTAVGVIAAPGAAQAHVLSKDAAVAKLYRHAQRVAAEVPPHAPGSQPELTQSKVRCGPAARTRGHGHRRSCRVTIVVLDMRDGAWLASRRCRDRSVRVALRDGARKPRVAGATSRFRCTVVEEPPTPAPAPPAPEPDEQAPAPPAGELPPGPPPEGPPDVPPGPPPLPAGVAATNDLTARAAQIPRPAYGFHSCSNWWNYYGWWVFTCWWNEGSSAPPGAHLIGWQNNWYYENWYWGYDASGRLGPQFWYWGRAT